MAGEMSIPEMVEDLVEDLVEESAEDLAEDLAEESAEDLAEDFLLINSAVLWPVPQPTSNTTLFFVMLVNLSNSLTS